MKKNSKRDIQDIMENINAPNIDSQTTRGYLKLTLMNTRRSAKIGLLLVVFPFIFVLANISKYGLGISLGFVTTIIEWVMTLDQVPVINWVIRIALIGGPVVGAVINLLAITHVFYDRESAELNISFKLRWLNVLIALFCLFIFLIFALYLITENLMEALVRAGI